MYNEYRVFGPPGTGKTTYLQDLIAEHARDNNPDDMVVASFTKAAAYQLARTGLDVERSNVGTLHAICYRALGGKLKIVESPKYLKAWNAEHETMKYPVRNFRIGVDISMASSVPSEDSAGEHLFNKYFQLRNKCVPQDQWPDRIVRLHNHWSEFKKTTGAVDFTDLIETCVNEEVRPLHSPRVGFYDEVQDFTTLELKLIRQWATYQDAIFLVGDDDQAIYEFRGSNPDGMLKPEIPVDRVKVLNQSYRLPAVVKLRAEAYMREYIQVRQPKEYEPRPALGDFHEHYGCLHPFRATSPLVYDIIKPNMAAGRTTMVLGSCGYMLNGIRGALMNMLDISFHNPYAPHIKAWQHTNRLGEKPMIILGTIHSVKGGEADDVVVYPDLSPQMMRAHVTPYNRRFMDGVVHRMHYVAMTRARHAVWVAGAAHRCNFNYYFLFHNHPVYWRNHARSLGYRDPE